MSEDPISSLTDMIKASDRIIAGWNGTMKQVKNLTRYIDNDGAAGVNI